MTEKKCQHRWEPSTFGEKHWAPGTWQFTCKRCGDAKMVKLGGSDATGTTSEITKDSAGEPTRSDSQPA